MELQLEDLETAATGDELAAETAAVGKQTVQFQRKRPSRKRFPDHLQRDSTLCTGSDIGQLDCRLACAQLASG